MTRLQTSISQVADIALSVTEVGQAPMVIDRDAGRITVQKETATNMSGKQYEVPGGSLEVKDQMTDMADQIISIKVRVTITHE